MHTGSYVGIDVSKQTLEVAVHDGPRLAGVERPAGVRARPSPCAATTGISQPRPTRHPGRASRRLPHRNQMRERLASAEGKALYKLPKQTVGPVFGQIKAARALRQFLRRGLPAVEAEWSLLCTAHNILKLHRATERP
jgi:hypothetical protein